MKLRYRVRRLSRYLTSPSSSFSIALSQKFRHSHAMTRATSFSASLSLQAGRRRSPTALRSATSCPRFATALSIRSSLRFVTASIALRSCSPLRALPRCALRPPDGDGTPSPRFTRAACACSGRSANRSGAIPACTSLRLRRPPFAFARPHPRMA